MNYLFTGFVSWQLTSDRQQGETHPFLRRYHSALPQYHPVTPTRSSGLHIICSIARYSARAGSTAVEIAL
ncbi:hypothetical protein N7491_010951 [Penicillium cf. griseofulvum]|uniref:Uncharacterized protein n=1 Tax=Penicillium cf. griseofulvum TaxID=2972120 RepID=A0A9W9T6I4_9EURO|nr:hypothetical protein N7472_001270 [Penicillium cf. griseofulvum]KAJ5422506.1 hypothetical protein N7491_010951 [Penicillium cf. griseofulvum]